MAAVQNGHLEVDTTNCRSAEELKNDKKNSGNPPACACWRTPWSFLWRAWSPFHLRCRPGKGRGRILFADRVTRTWVEGICNLRSGKLKPTLKETLVWITCYSSFLHSYQSFLTLTNTGQGASREGSSSCRSWSQHSEPSQRKHRSSLTFTFDQSWDLWQPLWPAIV